MTSLDVKEYDIYSHHISVKGINSPNPINLHLQPTSKQQSTVVDTRQTPEEGIADRSANYFHLSPGYPLRYLPIQ